MDAANHVEEFLNAFSSATVEIKKLIVGHDDIIQGMLICLFVGGHALLEGAPGLGKTLLVKTVGQCFDLDFSRI